MHNAMRRETTALHDSLRGTNTRTCVVDPPQPPPYRRDLNFDQLAHTLFMAIYPTGRFYATHLPTAPRTKCS